MQYKTFKQHKLVRDKIVEIMQQHGSKLYWYQLSDKDFQKQLKIKLLEEANEVVHAGNQQDIMHKLADLLEVIECLAKAHQISWTQLQAEQQKKRNEKGGFDQKIFVTFAEHPKDSPAERYCLSDSDKYPEIKL